MAFRQSPGPLESRRPLNAGGVVDCWALRSRLGESEPGGCGMWVWIVGAVVVVAVPFFTFAWKTK
jgi:hypothetical protein